jgi:hypothetical protein
MKAIVKDHIRPAQPLHVALAGFEQVRIDSRRHEPLDADILTTDAGCHFADHASGGDDERASIRIRAARCRR